MDTTQANAILDRLNGYDSTHPEDYASNIWQDVILTLDGYDQDATEALDRSDSSDAFVADGEVFRWDGSRHIGAQWTWTED